jgi:hypothetical protein
VSEKLFQHSMAAAQCCQGVYVGYGHSSSSRALCMCRQLQHVLWWVLQTGHELRTDVCCFPWCCMHMCKHTGDDTGTCSLSSIRT